MTSSSGYGLPDAIFGTEQGGERRGPPGQARVAQRVVQGSSESLPGQLGHRPGRGRHAQAFHPPGPERLVDAERPDDLRLSGV